MSDKKSGSKLIIAVIVIVFLLFVVVGVIGILAAIAIPAFVGYEQKSKMTEARVQMLVFSSAIEIYHLNNCKFPPPMKPSSKLPQDGEALTPNFTGPGWDELNLLGDTSPRMFQYASTISGDTLTLTAMADFDPGGPVHTVTQTITKSATDDCAVESGELIITNEGE